MTIYYTGVGSRDTPDNVIRWFKIYADVLAQLGLTLRSGAAPGADAAFEEGCDRVEGLKEIYLPWKNFQKSTSQFQGVSPEAQMLAAEVYGPQYSYLKRPVKLLMSRNIYQVTGLTLDKPSKFVLCWTPDGCSSANERSKKSGGTGQAIAYASTLGIPIFNIQRDGVEDAFLQYLNKEFSNDTSPEVQKR